MSEIIYDVSEQDAKEAVEFLTDFCNTREGCGKCPFEYKGYTKPLESCCSLRRIFVGDWRGVILKKENGV